jgi:hypothetical protein
MTHGGESSGLSGQFFSTMKIVPFRRSIAQRSLKNNAKRQFVLKISGTKCTRSVNNTNKKHTFGRNL